MRKKPSKPNTISLPPRLPQNAEELERVITLLGNRKQAELTPPAREELQKLLGVYPSMKEASFWKRVLHQVCQEAVRSAK